MSSSSVLLTTIFPIAGISTSILLFLSPFSAVRRALLSQERNEINLFPFIFMFLNGISWILYSFPASNPYVFFANIPSIPLSLYYFLGILCLEKRNHIRTMSIWLVSGGLLVILSVSASCFLLPEISNSTAKLATGICATVVVTLFYTSPLSTLIQVVETRNSLSIHLGLALASLCNASLWVVYGLCVQDYFVMGPNAFGVVLAFIQLALRWIYPASVLPSNDCGNENVDLESSQEVATIAVVNEISSL